MERLIQALNTDRNTLVVENGTVHTYKGRGIADLYRLLLKYPEVLKGARVADKVVGKAAAALMVLGGVKELYAVLISRPALDLFEKYGMKVQYTASVEHIFNRDKTGLCPMESCCLDCDTPAACLEEIKRTMIRLKSNR